MGASTCEFCARKPDIILCFSLYTFALVWYVGLYKMNSFYFYNIYHIFIQDDEIAEMQSAEIAESF